MARPALPALALFVGAIVFALFPAQFQDAWVWAMLTALALAAHSMPVDLQRGGVRIVFSLPFVGAVAAGMGTPAALLTDLAVALLAGLLALARRPTRESVHWVAVNAAVAALCVGAGAIGLAAASSVPLAGASGYLLRALGFLTGYGCANVALVTGLDAALLGRPVALAELAAIRPGVRVVGLYALLGLAISALVYEGAAWLTPLALVPVWALREALLYRARLYESYCGTITALNLMLQRAHPYTHGHLERVASAAEDVALRLGLEPERARMVREAAILHDIGKIAVDEEILDKPARLTDQEMDHVRRHSEWGACILEPVRAFSEIVPWIRHHHERPDGTGYPDRLSDVEIPIESKIIAVVDAFDAMTGSEHPSGKRPYRESMTVSEALQELERCSGTQFDPAVVRAFRAVVRVEARG